MKPCGRAGLTLVEVLVAAFLLEVGLLAALSLVTVATRQAVRAARTEDLVSAVARVADSLVALDSVRSGSGSDGRITVRWNTRAPLVEIAASHDGADTVHLAVAHGGTTRAP